MGDSINFKWGKDSFSITGKECQMNRFIALAAITLITQPEGLAEKTRLATNAVATLKKGPVVMVDARKTGRTLPNQSSVMIAWNGRNVDWSVKNENAAKYPISGFVEYVELIACTGGNKDRDLFKNPDDRTVIDDYDFEPLAKVCREILNIGAKPYLKLGNVPQKFTVDYSGGEFSINVRPPTDHLLL